MITYLNPPVREEFLGYGPINVPMNTGGKMRDIIRESSKNPYVRKWAEKIVEGVQDRDEIGEVEGLFDFVQMKTRYAHDPKGTEFIQTPPYILKHIELGDKPSLDCDDYTVLGLSLARSLGYPTLIRITGYKDDGKFSHVYGLVKIRGKWVTFDAVRKDQKLGWKAPGMKRKMDILV